MAHLLSLVVVIDFQFLVACKFFVIQYCVQCLYHLFSHWANLLQDGVHACMCVRVCATCSSREHWLRTTRVKYERASSACICDDDVKGA